MLEEGACVSAQFLLGWVLTATTRLSRGQSPTLAVLVAAAVRCERPRLAENRPWHARFGLIDRRHLRRRDRCGFSPNQFAV
jgi:hypothetical protein